MTLFDLMLNKQDQAKIQDIDKLTIELLEMLAIYEDTKHLPYEYVKKLGARNVNKRIKEVENLDKDFKDWLLKYEMERKDRKGKFSVDSLPVSDQICLISKIDKKAFYELKQILLFSSVDEKKIYFESIGKEEERVTVEKPDLNNIYIPSWESVYCEMFSYGGKEAWGNDSIDVIKTDWKQFKTKYGSPKIAISYRKFINFFPSDFKCDSKYFSHFVNKKETDDFINAQAAADEKYEAEMKQYEEDLGMYEKFKTMLDHPPAHPQKESVDPSFKYTYYIALTEEGRKVYNFVIDAISKVQSNSYDGGGLTDEEAEGLEKRSNYRENLEQYLGQDIHLKCDNFSVEKNDGHNIIIGRQIQIIDDNGNPGETIDHMYFFVSDDIETYRLPVKLHVTGTIRKYKYENQLNIGILPKSIWFTIV